MTEWRDIAGYEGLYQVSDDGLVRSLGRTVDKGQWGIVTFPPRLLKSSLREGYPSVFLYGLDRVKRSHSVHRLVAGAFMVSSHFDGALALHRDGDRTNNHVGNLYWGTHADNLIDAVAHGTHPKTAVQECPQGHRYDDQNTIHKQAKGRRTYRACRACKRDQDRNRRTKLVMAEVRELKGEQ